MKRITKEAIAVVLALGMLLGLFAGAIGLLVALDSATPDPPRALVFGLLVVLSSILVCRLREIDRLYDRLWRLHD